MNSKALPEKLLPVKLSTILPISGNVVADLAINNSVILYPLSGFRLFLSSCVYTRVKIRRYTVQRIFFRYIPV